ncbi:MAG: lipopolysaccharide biosynthesis protein [Bacteroidales bacterium]|jgi:O-antigen/teichoic acid export membrane protein|nr:lipopolysaccharide biosynthesis protein [Bacteroidales bacterium]
MTLFKEIKKLLFTESFKYSAALLSSNAIAQIIGFVAYIFITRLYSQETFGEFNLFLSIAGILTLFTTGKYELATVIESSEKKRNALLQLNIFINTAVTIIASIVIIIGQRYSLFTDKVYFSKLLYFLPLFLFIGGLWQTMNYYFTSQKKYYNISVYNISQSLIGSLAKIFLGVKSFLHSGLLYGTFIGQIFGLILSFFKSGFVFSALKIDKKELKSVAKTYSNFPKYELPNELLNNLAGNLPILLLSFYFDMVQIGLFSLALSVGFRPINMFCNSIYQVLFKQISDKVTEKQSIKKDIYTFCKLCLVGISPFFIAFMFVSKPVFAFIFSAEWIEAGVYFRYMLPWLFCVVLVSSLAFIPDLFFKQKTAMNIEIIYVAVRVLALFAGIGLKSFEWAIIFYCGVSAIMLTVKLIWYFYLVHKYEQK